MSRNKPGKLAYPRLIKVMTIIGLFLIFAFPVGMLFVGFATIEVNCLRKDSGQLPNCEIRETRLFGLFDRRVKVLNVSGVGYRTQDVNPRASVTLASTVVLEGSNGSIPVTQVSSSVGDDWKSGLISKTQRFLDSADEHAYSLHISERNIFGWIGVIYVAFFAWSYIAWFVRKIKGRGR